MNIRPYDIVLITMSRWDGEVSSAILSLARELALKHRVYYWDHPFSYKDLLSNWNHPGLQTRRESLMQGKLTVKKIPGMPDGFRAVTPPLTLPINWMKPGKVYERASRWNDHILNKALQELIRRENIERYIFLNSFDPFFFRKLNPEPMPMLRIYQSRDDISQEAYIARHGIYLEREQLQAAGLRLATSRLLREKLNRPETPVVTLPNAADTGLFSRALKPGPIPEDWPLPKTGRPVIGYIGSLSSLRMDYPMLSQTVALHPDKDFVFIGSGRFEDRQLAASPNVKLLGPRPLLSLPDYLRAMDVAIIPFLCNTLTSSIYPLKINEYLAAGKPVVSTAFSGDIRDFEEVVYLAESPVEFPELLNRALAEDNETRRFQRTAVARENSWSKRAQAFEELVGHCLQNTVPWQA